MMRDMEARGAATVGAVERIEKDVAAIKAILASHCDPLTEETAKTRTDIAALSGAVTSLAERVKTLERGDET